MNPMKNVYRKRLLCSSLVVVMSYNHLVIYSFGIHQGILWDVLGWCCCIFEVELFVFFFFVRFLELGSDYTSIYFPTMITTIKITVCVCWSSENLIWCSFGVCLVYKTLWCPCRLLQCFFLQWFFRVWSMNDMFNSYMLLEYLATLCW